MPSHMLLLVRRAEQLSYYSAAPLLVQQSELKKARLNRSGVAITTLRKAHEGCARGCEGKERPAKARKSETQPTWHFVDRSRGSGGESFISGVRANPSSLQQRLQRFRLAGLVLTAQPGAASPGVDAARLAVAQRAGHAAAAAGLAHLLGAVLGQRFAQEARAGVARLAFDHGSDCT